MYLCCYVQYTGPSQMTDPSAAHVLIVEDDIGVAGLLCRMVRHIRPGVRVTECHTAGAALVALADTTIDTVDTVLTDLHLPDSDGFLFIGQLRRQGVTARIILITGATVDPSYAQQVGANVVLAKPLTLEQLRRALQFRVAEA